MTGPAGTAAAGVRRSFLVTVIVTLLAWIGLFVAPSSATDFEVPDGRRLLVVALDAVPFEVVEQAVAASREGGDVLFDEMSPPVPIISSFPSTTTLAFTGMFETLGLETPPGYEARFYDLNKGKVRGGGLVSYGKIAFSWRDFFDFKVAGALRKGWGYARPLKFGKREIEKGIQSFLASDRQVFFLYISATDGVAHLKGPEALVEVLRRLDDAIRVARGSEKFYTVLLSDHGVGGGEPLRNVRKDVKSALREEGFRLRKRIRSENDLVLVRFGLLSSFVAFVEPGEEPRAVELLGALDGVSLCAAPSGVDRWTLVGSGGEGTLERREMTEEPSQHEPPSQQAPGQRERRVEWRYLADRGDPLETSSLAGGWISDEVWLAESGSGRFPDAAHRIARAFDLVRNPASVVCSVAPGFMFGSALTDWSGRLTVGRLRWTHGALERSDTLGFLVTDLPFWKNPPMLRFDRTIQALRANRQ